jgi:hypothetical protein
MTLKVPERLDRDDFWLWAVCLVFAHIVLTLLSAGGGPFGALDTLAIVALALVVGARFRDIGWPVWIGPTFMLVTMLALPLVAVGYAIATNLSPPELLKLMNAIGLVAGPTNLLLLIVAGSVRGTAAANPSAQVVMPEPSAVAPDMMATATPAPDPSRGSEDATSQPSAAPAVSGRTGLLIVGGGGLVILLIVGSFLVRTVPPAPVNTATPAPPASNLQSNGLTKETNDFLQQLSRQQPAKR